MSRTMEEADMTCRELVELVTDYLEGALPAPQRARFEAHLEECEGCDSYLAQMRTTIRLVGGLSEETIDSTVQRRLLEAFRGWQRA